MKLRASFAVASLILAISLSAIWSSSASAVPLLYDPFDYDNPPERLLGQVNTYSPAGNTWLVAANNLANDTTAINTGSGSLTGPSELKASIGNNVAITGNGTFASATNRLAYYNNNTTAIATGTVYYSFLLRVDALTASNNGIGGFFFALNNTGDVATTPNPSVAPARMQARIDPTDGTKYSLGIFTNRTAGAGDASWVNGLTVGDTIFVVGAATVGPSGANVANTLSQMWINPDPATFDLPTAPTATVSDSTASTAFAGGLRSVILRQSPAPYLTMDELRVATTWAEVTPTSIPTYYWDIDGVTAGAGGGTTPGGTWDDVTANWSTSPDGDAATQALGDDAKVVFSAGTNATGAYTVTLSGSSQSASKLTFKNGTPTLSGSTLNLTLQSIVDATAGQTGIIASEVAGSNGLRKEGTGTLVLSGTNSYSGPTNITAGTLQLGDGGSSGSLNTSSVITMTGRFTVNQSDAVVQGTDFNGGPLTGSGGLTQAGSGTTTLNVANTFSGTTRVSAGTLSLTHSLALQNSTLEMNGTDTGAMSFDSSLSAVTLGGLTGSRDLSLLNSASAALAVSVGNNINNINSPAAPYTGILSGSGSSLTKIGSSYQILSGANTYNAGTTINAGILQFGQTNAMPGTGNVTVNSGGTLAVNVGGGGEWTYAPSGGGTTGGLIAGVGGQNVVDQVTWNPGSSFGIDTSNVGGLLTYNDVIGNFRTTGGGTTNAVGIAKLGGGTLELTAANIHTGNTYIGVGVSNTNRSILKISSSSSLPTDKVLTMAAGDNPHNRLELAQGVEVSLSDVVGGGLNNGGTFEDASLIDVGFGELTFNIPTGQTTTVGPFIRTSYNVGDDTHGVVVKDGLGTLSLPRNNGTSQFSGEWIVNAGRVNIVQNNSFAAGNSTFANAKLTMNGGTIANTSGAALSIPIRNVDIGGSFTFDTVVSANTEFIGLNAAVNMVLKAANPTITVLPPGGDPANANAGALIFRGKISDQNSGRGFTKAGEGILNITRPDNSYTGDTFIAGGVLRLTNETAAGDGASSQGVGALGSQSSPGTVHFTGGSLATNGSPNPAVSNQRTNIVANPLNVTTAGSVMWLPVSSFGATADTTMEMSFTSNDISGSAKLTIHNNAPNAADNATNGKLFRARFSGAGSEFDFSGDVEIKNSTLNATRTAQLASSNTSGTQTWAGVISGDGSLLRDGANGTTALSGANTYSGGTTVNDGTLAASGSSARFGTGNVTVNGGALEIMAGVGNAIANSATLSVMSAGQVLLGTGINEVLALLNIDNGAFTFTTGTYGSDASDADNFGLSNPDDYFSGLGMLTITPFVPGVPGDYNENDVVDAADYVSWRKRNPDPDGPALPNDDTNGVTSGDYTRWTTHFGETLEEDGNGGSVPEPGSVALVMIATLGLCAWRRRSN